MFKNPKVLSAILLITILFVSNCRALETIKINDLIENAAAMDNREVTVQGEAIGEALERGEYAWINISDMTNAIGVWVKRSDIRPIEFYGDYKNRGDTVQITGVFHKACTEHGGDVDIHCSRIEIVETGHYTAEQLSIHKLIFAALAILAFIFVLAVYYRLKKKSV